MPLEVGEETYLERVEVSHIGKDGQRVTDALDPAGQRRPVHTTADALLLRDLRYRLVEPLQNDAQGRAVRLDRPIRHRHDGREVPEEK